MEIIGSVGMGIGGLLTLVAWIWLVVIAFKEGGAIWGIVVLLFSWIGGLAFCLVNKTGWMPYILMIAGMISMTGGAFLTFPSFN